MMGSDTEEKKMVQRVKEILHDRPEQEIYAMLKECSMDPDEAVQRLLCQDTFQEVKSKRDRRKEMREAQDTKYRIGGGVSNGGWSIDRDDHRTMTQSKSNAPGTTVFMKRENGSVASSLSYSSSTIQAASKTISQQSSHVSNSFNAENRGHTIGTGNTTMSSQPPTSSGLFGPTAGIGRPSIADIVRKGSLHNGSLELTETFPNHQDSEQESDGHGCSENLSSVGYSTASTRLLTTSDDQAVARQNDGSHEQTTSNGEITCKQRSQEDHVTASDFHQASYLRRLLPEQTTEDVGMVVLPGHLQALAADCSHLSFGTFNSRPSSASVGFQLPNSSKIESEKLSTAGDALLTQQLYSNVQLLTEMPPMSSQLGRQQMVGAAFGDERISVLSDSVSRDLRNSSHGLMWEPGYTSSYRKDGVPPYVSEMLGYSKGMQGNLLASTGQSFRTDAVQSVYHETPQAAMGYGAPASAFKSSTVALPETLSPDTFSSFEPSSRAPLASQLPQQLLEQAYSQQTNLLKPYANLSSYQNNPKEYGQIPLYQSARNTKLGVPQYKINDLARNLETLDYDSSGFGNIPGFGNSAVASNLSAFGYNEMLQNQIIKERNHLLPHGLGDNGSTRWDYRARSGAIPTARENTYLNLLLEQQRNLGHQQDLQYHQHYSSLGNFSSDGSQVGFAADNNQLLQSFGDMTLNDPAETLSKQHQLWQQPRY